METWTWTAGSWKRTFSPWNFQRRFRWRVGFFWLQQMGQKTRSERKFDVAKRGHIFWCMRTQTILFMRRAFFWVKCVGKQQGPILILGFGFFWLMHWRICCFLKHPEYTMQFLSGEVVYTFDWKKSMSLWWVSPLKFRVKKTQKTNMITSKRPLFQKYKTSAV